MSDNSIFENSFGFFNDSYSLTTDNIKITVWPEFIDNQSNENLNIYIWIYHIKIENKNDFPVKLTKRHWKIIDEDGIVQEVEGEGVVGEKPLINSGKSFQYTSSVHLKTPSGIMGGNYEFVKYTQVAENEISQSTDEKLAIKIPSFSLDSLNQDISLN